jgi:hypothetical protein
MQMLQSMEAAWAPNGMGKSDTAIGLMGGLTDSATILISKQSRQVRTHIRSIQTRQFRHQPLLKILLIFMVRTKY